MIEIEAHGNTKHPAMRSVLKHAARLLAVVAATPWLSPRPRQKASLRVICSAHWSVNFAAAAASGSKKNSKEVYVRGYGRGLSASPPSPA